MLLGRWAVAVAVDVAVAVAFLAAGFPMRDAQALQGIEEVGPRQDPDRCGGSAGSGLEDAALSHAREALEEGKAPIALLFLELVDQREEASLLRARAFLAAGDPIRAREQLERLLGKGAPAHEEAALVLLLQVGRESGYEGFPEERFARILEAASRLRSQELAYGVARWRLHRSDRPFQENLERSEALFRSITTGHLAHRARFHLGIIQALRGEVESALSTLATILPLEGVEADLISLVHLATGRIHRERGDSAAALRAFLQVEIGSAGYAEALLERAWFHLQGGDGTRASWALRSLRLLREMKSQRVEIDLTLAQILLSQGRGVEAGPILQGIQHALAVQRDGLDRLQEVPQDAWLERYPDAFSKFEALCRLEARRTTLVGSPFLQQELRGPEGPGASFWNEADVFAKLRCLAEKEVSDLESSLQDLRSVLDASMEGPRTLGRERIEALEQRGRALQAWTSAPPSRAPGNPWVLQPRESLSAALQAVLKRSLLE